MGWTLKILPHRLGIYKLPPTATVPQELLGTRFISITRCPTEISIVCEEGNCPGYEIQNNGWRCLKVDASLPLDAIGVLASISTALASAGVSIYVVSTYETDYVLVKDAQLACAIDCLTEAGHQVYDGSEF